MNKIKKKPTKLFNYSTIDLLRLLKEKKMIIIIKEKKWRKGKERVINYELKEDVTTFFTD
jgi:hypothetical protein